MRNSTTLGVCLAACFSAPGVASAYTLHRTVDGLPVSWRAPSVNFVVDASLESISPAALAAASRAFQAWASVSGASAPAVVLERGIADEVGYRPGGENHSTVRYAPGGFAPAGDALAITVLTFDAGGTILDADLVVSGAVGRSLAVLPDPSVGVDAYVFDLQNLLTHEAGHCLGLAHNNDDASVTMYPVLDPHDTSKCQLRADDEDGLRALYTASAGVPAAASCAVGSGPIGSAGRWVQLAGVAFGAAVTLRSRGRWGRPLALAAAIGLLALGPGTAAMAGSVSTAAAVSAPTAVARVAAATPRWVGGLVVTRLTLDAPRGEGGQRAGGPFTIDVLGGAIDGIEQIVGGSAVPAAGTELPVRWRGEEMVPTGSLLEAWEGGLAGPA